MCREKLGVANGLVWIAVPKTVVAFPFFRWNLLVVDSHTAVVLPSSFCPRDQ